MFWIRDFIARIFMMFCRVFPVDSKKVVFKSDRGLHCSDSPFALFSEIRKSHPDLDCVWILKRQSVTPEGARSVTEGSLRELWELATAKYWIDNKRKGCWAIKRKGQIYIQTWHGALFLKKLEKDIESLLPAYYVKSAKMDSANADYFLSSSRWTTDYYRKSFWYHGEVLEYGLPRSDIFYQKSVDVIQNVYRRLKLNTDVNLVLYAPTFRDDKRVWVYNLEYLSLKRLLEARFGGEWKFIIRMHPNLQGKCEIASYDDVCLDGNQFEDISELIVASTMVITDYSSCMFDAMEADKIVFLYAPDINEYGMDRGFTFRFEELPFTLVEKNTEWEKALRDFDKDDYQAEVQRFEQKLRIFNDGHASERVIRHVFDNRSEG